MGNNRTRSVRKGLMEIFKQINGYKGFYEVSNYGRVKALKRIITGKNGGKYPFKEMILGQHNNPNNNYSYVILYNNGAKTHRVHQLVWDCFGDKPRNGRTLQIDHISGDKTDNNIDNLQLLTARENTAKFHRAK